MRSTSLEGLNTFDRWWAQPGEWVEPPNQRKVGESGVQRLRSSAGPLLYSKRQIGQLYRTPLYPVGRPTVLRELQALRALKRLGIKVPEVVYGAAQKIAGEWHALLVTEALEGFSSLEQWYADEGARRWGLALHQQMLQQLALILARLHLSGWQHGALYPKHIFIRVHASEGPRVEIALLDLAKCRRRFSRYAASRGDLQQLSRHRRPLGNSDWRVFIEAYQNAFDSDYL